MSRPITKAKGRLTTAVTAASTSIVFTPTDSTRDLESVTMSDFGTTGYITLNPTGSRDNYEVASFTSWSVSGSIITLGGLTRDLELEGNDTSGTGKAFAAGTTVIISTNHHWFNQVVRTEDAQTVAGVKTFSALPATTAGDPVADNDLARKAYVDATATGGATVAKLVVSGTGGEVIAAGEVVYLDETDNEWKLADASASSTSDNVQLGIAQGAGTDGGAITGGVLLQGRDANQSGLTQGDRLYISDTAGAVASSAGTVEVEIGHAVSATEMDFVPKFASYTTKSQRDALVGSSGTPGSGNKYITENDVAASGASKVVRSEADSLINDSLLGLTTAGDVVYSDGTDLTRLAIGTAGQALKVNSGATAPEWAGVGNLVEADLSSVSVSNTTTETTLFSTSIPANTLSTGNMVKARVFFTGLKKAASGHMSLRVKYGSTTIVNGASIFDGVEISGDRAGTAEITLVANGATNAQKGSLVMSGSTNASATANAFRYQATGSAAEDSTGALNLVFTIQFQNASINSTITVSESFVEIVSTTL